MALTPGTRLGVYEIGAAMGAGGMGEVHRADDTRLRRDVAIRSKGAEMKSMSEVLLQELEQEGRTTRRVLERVPDAHLAWKPHAKSRSLGQLALHIATVPGGVATLASTPVAQAPSFGEEPAAATAAELLPALDESLATARGILQGLDDESMMATFKVMAGDREVMAMPRIAFLRAIMLNHWYHHRGQLSVYLRELNVPVPSIYGPSADENPFAGS